MIVQVAPLLRLPYARDCYDYSAEEGVAVGELVSIPLRRKQIYGVVLSLEPDRKRAYRLLACIRLKPLFVLPAPTLRLFRWMREEYGVGFGVLLRSTFSFLDLKKLSLPAPTPPEPSHMSAKHPIWRQAMTSDDYRREIELVYQQYPQKQILAVLPNSVLLDQLAQACIAFKPVVLHSDYPRLKQRAIGHAASRGEPMLILSTRIGLFLPLSKLAALLLLYENHEDHGAFEMTPRYWTEPTAATLAAASNVPYTRLGSAPSLGLFAELHQTNVTQTLSGPTLRVVDLEDRPPEERLVSEQCRVFVTDALAKGQSLVLIHEYAKKTKTVRCRCCHVIARCSCAKPLVLSNSRLFCRACKRFQPPFQCAQCAGSELIIEPSVVEKIAKMLPGDVREFSADHPTLPAHHGPIVLLATSYVFDRIETVAKHLGAFAGIGVLSLDGMLSNEGYRSAELLFSRLVTLAGIARQNHWNMFVQTRASSLPLFTALQSGSFSDFYTAELAERKRFGFPPFSTMLIIHLRKKVPILVRFLKRYADDATQSFNGPEIVLRWNGRCPERRNIVQSLLLDRFAGALSIEVH